MMGGSTMIFRAPWPKANPALVKDDQMVLGVQVNGKLRGELRIDVEASREEIESQALALEGVQKYLEGGTPKKVIIVPKRIVNVVI